MHSTNSPTDDEAVEQQQYHELDAIRQVPPRCGPWWRWTPFLLIILLSLFTLYDFADHMGESFYVILFILPPLLMIMVVQLFVLGKGLGRRAFGFALLRLFIALGFFLPCAAIPLVMFLLHSD